MGNRLAIAILAVLASASCSSAAPAGTTRVVVHSEGQGNDAWSLVGWRQGHSGDLCMAMRGPDDRAITGGCGFTLTPALHGYSPAGVGVIPGDAGDRIVFGVLPTTASTVQVMLRTRTGARAEARSATGFPGKYFFVRSSAGDAGGLQSYIVSDAAGRQIQF